MVGESAAMKEIFHLIERAGASDRAILIQGESGTGRELFAEALHRASQRAERPCAASVRLRKVDVRLLAATNRDLPNEIRAGRFREDLGDDWHIEDDALQALNRYAWPGNVRQLSNVLERAKILTDADVIRLKDLPKEVTLGSGSTTIPSKPDVSAVNEATDDLNSFQKQVVLSVLQR